MTHETTNDRTGRALLLVGHGSRNAAANAEFEALVAAYRSHREGELVMHGYIELASPSLDDALDALARRSELVVVLPVFLFSAGHVKNDVPLALGRARQSHPSTRFIMASALGVQPDIAELAYERARNASTDTDAENETSLLVVGRGSSDPDANGDMLKQARMVAEGRAFERVEAAFMGITTPTVDQALTWIGRCRPRRILVLPYLLFAGRLIDRLERTVTAFSEQHPWIRVDVASHLEPDTRLFQAFDQRLDDALEGRAASPCDGCQYRVALPGRAEQEGGLRALMWSLRHTFTHTQAMPHEHAHAGLRKHIFVCTNADCAERGSTKLVTRLRRAIKARGRQLEHRVTRTACMGRCGEGPAVAIYPDGVWYRGVSDDDAEQIVDDHLERDRLVAHLVDDILQ